MPEEVKPEVEETEEEVETPDDGEETEEESGEEWSPPSKEEWDKLNRVAKSRKTERDNAKRELAQKRDAEKEPEDEGKVEAAKWRESAARSSAATALQAAGYAGSAKQARLLTRLLDVSQAEPDESGDFDFEDEIEELKENFPALFAKEKPRTPTVRPTTADKGGSSDAPGRDKTTERMLKMAGYR